LNFDFNQYMTKQKDRYYEPLKMTCEQNKTKTCVAKNESIAK